MRIIVGVLQIILGLLATVVGAILCFLELFGERSDWASVMIGVVMLLVGVGGIWAGLNRTTRGCPDGGGPVSGFAASGQWWKCL